MELFLLGVGNYTEADVEAATAAWTGHTHVPTDRNSYLFDADLHETAPQQLLGRTINDTRPPNEAGIETIEVILGTGSLGSGSVPQGAERNAGRPSREVAAEFLTFKLWQAFGEATTGSVPGGVQSAMVAGLLDNESDIRPWVRAMLVHDDFYTATARSGLVRQPVAGMLLRVRVARESLYRSPLGVLLDSVWLVSEMGDPAAGERRRQLLGIKLKALVADHVGGAVGAEPSAFGAGSALVHDGAAWTLIDGPSARRLGAALAWAVRHGATSLDVIVERDGGILARRAAAFDFPIRVWFAEERVLLPVVAEDPTAAQVPTADHLALTEMIDSAGATPHVERGVVTGEVRGLEVCRVVDEPTTGNFAELSDVPTAETVAPDDAELAARLARREADGVILEVGVGANDREAFQMLHGHLPTTDALANVVAAVTEHRSDAASAHPLNRMATERYLRWCVEEDPSLLGLTEIMQVDPPVDRMSMKHVEPCVAAGVDIEGRSVAVVFTSGVDLDLISFVADVALQFDAEADRFIVTGLERDLVPINRDLASKLAMDVEFIPLT